MRIPRLNRLTGFRWWQSIPVRDDSEASRLRQEATIQAMILQPGPCAIGKIGTSELLVLEYPHRWIRPPWPAPASWHRPTERLFHSGGLFPLEKQIFKRFVRELPVHYTAVLPTRILLFSVFPFLIPNLLLWFPLHSKKRAVRCFELKYIPK